jgi:hypothetical protein
MAATGKPNSLAAWNDGAAKSQILDLFARVPKVLRVTRYL